MDARLDVKYKKASNKHIIIELKRGNRTVKTDELFIQVRKYFKATTKILEKHNMEEPFEIIVLLGEHLDGKNFDQKEYEATKRSLKEFNCRIMYYDELLKNAENLYSDFLEKNKSLSTLSNLINEMDIN